MNFPLEPAVIRRPRRAAMMMGVALSVLTGCDAISNLDIDLRNRSDGFTTADAVANLPDRPRPDNRGIISYPGYQVVVAERGDTARSIATRLGLNASQLAEFNGIEADTALRRDELLALPARVAEPSPATGATTTGPILPASEVNVTELAGAAIDRAEDSAPTTATVTPTSTTTPQSRPDIQTGAEPIRHRVERGETVYGLARRYNVPVNALAEWNGLPSDLSLREGQFLLIPQGDTPPPAAAPTTPEVAQPGTGSATPVPPSADDALPEDETPTAQVQSPSASPASPPDAPEVPSQNLGETQTETPDARFVNPVDGRIIRDYAQGRNEGVDFGASAGAPVRAAAPGTVAAITTNTDGIQIVVIRHEGTLLTVYTHVDDLTVEQGSRVSQGQTIGSVLEGDPSFLHFEVRNGMESLDPAEYLP